MTSTPDFDTLKQVARMTGGAFVTSSAGFRDMEQLYTEIRRSVKAVERTSQQRETYRSAFQVPLGLAVALLLGAAWLGRGPHPAGRARVLLAGALLAIGLLSAPARADDPLLEADRCTATASSHWRWRSWSSCRWSTPTIPTCCSAWARLGTGRATSRAPPGRSITRPSCRATADRTAVRRR